ncbi:MAG: cytochrome C biogenesis protein [Candidatus Yanofskybacteria bacterium CG10_big_fil_rev_8_21_14_0_10_36_16]|uniref:Cytochrome C biogenesis protein n=1 Tax=Candidatus Yanofskybacteria bacterium CG10_big_fil_rev_8_21_14_0_10_36_16 TaxID=1975096 RepID=A0A2J0Q7M6_9BACT|nr:MAG: cytochrome C biogenesis protein [Candidatus Yanofskybacteria bacterium CG10_big_fil_rev_8_21_14_0_10_36_16]
MGLAFSSFVAGFFTFFAPCTLPLVPAFLGLISGVPQEELSDPAKLKLVRWKIFSNAFFYVLGFSIVFILFGVAFSFLGQIIGVKIWLQRIGGILIVLFGLFIMGVLKVNFLNAEKKIYIPVFFQKPTKGNSFFLGSLFALGWSPCVGPILGSVLLIASTQGQVFQGIYLLALFSAGLAIPFLLTALLIGKSFTTFSKMDRIMRIINIIAGVFLIFLGFLLITDQFSNVFAQLQGFFFQFDGFQNFVNGFL